MGKYRSLDCAVNGFNESIKTSIKDVESFVDCYRKVEEYESVKYEQVINPHIQLKQLMSVLAEVKHPEKSLLCSHYADLTTAANQLEMKVKFFRSRMDQEVE
jgi:hypothetical protein